MNLNKSAIGKALALSLGINILVGMIFGLLGGAAAATTTGAIRGMLTGTAIVALLLGLGLMLLYGALYGFFARREATPVDMGNYAVGGAITVVLVGLVNLIVAASVGAVGMNMPGLDPDIVGTPARMTGLLAVAALFSLAINAVLGAIGGLLYAATHQEATIRMP